VKAASAAAAAISATKHTSYLIQSDVIQFNAIQFGIELANFGTTGA